jgi:hypothetical protein
MMLWGICEKDEFAHEPDNVHAISESSRAPLIFGELLSVLDWTETLDFKG